MKTRMLIVALIFTVLSPQATAGGFEGVMMTVVHRNHSSAIGSGTAGDTWFREGDGKALPDVYFQDPNGWPLTIWHFRTQGNARSFAKAAWAGSAASFVVDLETIIDVHWVGSGAPLIGGALDGEYDVVGFVNLAGKTSASGISTASGYISVSEEYIADGMGSSQMLHGFGDGDTVPNQAAGDSKQITIGPATNPLANAAICTWWMRVWFDAHTEVHAVAGLVVPQTEGANAEAFIARNAWLKFSGW